MPLIYIDGKELEAQAGQTIIEAAMNHGITIPHFCWHPALSVAGNCRMCLVNVGTHKKDQEGNLLFDDDGQPLVSWIPKMQIACATPVADGMVVELASEKTTDVQNVVMEFLLINHPLDCPICDEAGQCKLQEYAFTHSSGKSRFDEEKTHKEKRVEFGPNVMFDGDRCISCSRCIRFAAEVAKQPALTFVQRGDRVTIRTFPGTSFDNPYSMNVIDICPVGALTSIDFRFRARVWEMSFTDSICPGCARGCNISVGVMNNEVLRLEPRTNPHVNEYWMCDPGRLTTPAIVNAMRVTEPLVRENGLLRQATWQEAINRAAAELEGIAPSHIMVVGSALASNEDNYALAALAKEVLKTSNVDFIKHLDPGFADDMLRVSDVAPNAIGAHVVGIAPSSASHGMDTLADRVKRSDIKAVLMMADSAEAHSEALAAALAGVEHLILITPHMSVSAQSASVVLPMSTFAESDGTFTNTNHRVQHFSPAVATVDNARYMGLKMSRWDKFGAVNDRWTHGEQRNCRPGWKIAQAIAKNLGVDWGYASAEEVFNHIATSIQEFKGMSYAGLEENKGLQLNSGGRSEPLPVIYQSFVMKPQ